MKNLPPVTFTYRLPYELKEKLDKYMEKEICSRNTAISKILKIYFDNNKNKESVE